MNIEPWTPVQIIGVDWAEGKSLVFLKEDPEHPGIAIILEPEEGEFYFFGMNQIIAKAEDPATPPMPVEEAIYTVLEMIGHLTQLNMTREESLAAVQAARVLYIHARDIALKDAADNGDKLSPPPPLLSPVATEIPV
jgi:hypothetical protein